MLRRRMSYLSKQILTLLAKFEDMHLRFEDLSQRFSAEMSGFDFCGWETALAVARSFMKDTRRKHEHMLC